MNSLLKRLILTIGLFIYSWGLYAQDVTKIWNEVPSPLGWVSHFEELSLKIARAWKVGKQKKNNGILIAVSRGHRTIRIQNGSGVQDEISDNETKRIIDEVMIPQFKQDHYYQGVFEGILEIVKNI